MNRRSILQLFAAAPVGAPLAAKAAVESAAAELSKINAVGVGEAGPTNPSPGMSLADPTREQTHFALRVPETRAAIVSELYEQERRIWSIEPDLAVKRSFSLSAKIAFQRQRNVERRLAEMEAGLPLWQRLSKLIFDATARRLF